MNEQVSEKTDVRARRFLPYLLVVLGIFVYCNNLSGPFIYDDENAIVNNKHIRQLWPLWRAAASPGQSTVTNRPVVSISLAVNYAFGKYDVLGYHIFNITVHILCAMVLFGVVRRTLVCQRLRERFGRSAGPIALVCAAIWMVHPIQTECVNYIVQRTESIMGLFYLLTLYCTIRAFDSGCRRRWYIASVISCALGMASKEVMVTAPIMVLLYDRAFKSDSIIGAVRKHRRFYISLAATWCVLIGLLCIGPASKTAGFTTTTVPWDYAKNQCLVITDYLRLVFQPSPLALDYGYPQQLSVFQVVPYGLLILVLLIAALITFIRRQTVSYPAVWFFVILAPTSSFFPIATEIGGHRRMYLSLAGIIVLVVTGVYYLLSHVNREGPTDSTINRTRRWVAVLLSVSAIGMLSWATRQRNKDYHSAVSIWQSAVEAMPGNSRAYVNLGNALAAEGKTEKAIEHYRKAIEIWPHAEAHYNLAKALSAQGKLDMAIWNYRMAIEARGDFAQAHADLADIFGEQGESEMAIDHYRMAIEAQPDLAQAHNNLANIFMTQEELDMAVAHYRMAVEADPDAAEAHNNLANILRSQGKLEAAIAHYRRAVEAKPDFARAYSNLADILMAQGKFHLAVRNYKKTLELEPDRVTTMNRLSWLLATCPEPDVREAGTAVKLAKRACELTDYKRAGLLDTLAAAFAAAGQFPDAAATARKAIELAEGAGDKKSAEQIRKHLQLYEAGKPYLKANITE